MSLVYCFIFYNQAAMLQNMCSTLIILFISISGSIRMCCAMLVQIEMLLALPFIVC